MTTQEFIGKYTGKQIADNHGGYAGECLSLVKRYAQEVQGIPNADGVLYAPNGAAKDLYNLFTPAMAQHYDRIPASQPRQPGDLVVWGYEPFGDVAVALDSGNKVFGQLGTPKFLPAAIRSDNTKPLGYLRLKGGDVEEINKLRAELQKEREVNSTRENWLNQLAFDLGDDLDAVEQDDIDRMRARIKKLVEFEASGKTKAQTAIDALREALK